MELTKEEEQEVKKVGREMLETLVLDWRKRQQTRAAVDVAINDFLDQLPEKFDSGKFEEKCTVVFQLVFDGYFGEGESVYPKAG